MFGAYEALAARLWTVAADTELPVYVVPQSEVKVKVRSVTEQSLTGPGGALQTRRFEVTFQNPDRPVNGVVTVDEQPSSRPLRTARRGTAGRPRGRLERRDARPRRLRNPTDADFSDPGERFQPRGHAHRAARRRGPAAHPAVVLVGGATPAIAI